MGKFARMSEADAEGIRTALEIIEAEDQAQIADRYHPALAAAFISAPAAAAAGSTKNGQAWTHPEPVEGPGPEGPAPAMRTKLSRVEYKLQFTGPERIAIRQAREYAGDDANATMAAMVIDDFYDILEDPDLSGVDLTLPAVQEGHAFLVSIGLLTEDRKAEIERGMPA